MFFKTLYHLGPQVVNVGVCGPAMFLSSVFSDLCQPGKSGASLLKELRLPFRILQFLSCCSSVFNLA